MSSKNIKEAYSLVKSINNKINLIQSKRKNRFFLTKSNFLKPSNISPILNSFNDGYRTYRPEIVQKNKNGKNQTLNIERKNKNLNKLFMNIKNIQIKKNNTLNVDKLKKLNNKFPIQNHRNDFSLNSFKNNLTLQNHKSFNNTKNSFLTNNSKSKSINKEQNKSNKVFQTISNNGKFHVAKVIPKDKNKINSLIIKNKINIINKKYIYVQNKSSNNKLQQVCSNNKSYKLNCNQLNSERLNQRSKKMNLNDKNHLESIVIPNNQFKYNNNCKKKFTFNDLKVHNNKLMNKKDIDESYNKKQIKNNYNNNNKIPNINLLKNILFQNNNYSNKVIKKNNKNQNCFNNQNYHTNILKNKIINKTQDIINNRESSPNTKLINRKNNSVKRAYPFNTNEIISKILNNPISLEKSIDNNNSFQNTTTNYLFSKKKKFNINKNNKKINGFCNLLILDNKEKRELYAQVKNHKSFTEKSKLLDYINFKVNNNTKMKEIKKDNKIQKEKNINIKNKFYKIENISKNIKNSSNYTNSYSNTIETNKTNYISPKQFKNKEKDNNAPLLCNKNALMTVSNSLKIAINNKNKISINKNNNIKKLGINKAKNSVINKMIQTKKIIHDKNSPVSNTSFKKKSIIKDKNNLFKIPPKLALTPMEKQNAFIKKIKLKNANKIPIIKKVIKIDSCSVPGYSSPGISKINQDNYFIIKEFMNNPEYFFMGICDGHGSYGHLISKYICNNLPKKLTKISEENIIKSFLSTNKSLIEESKIDCSLSGSTCCLLIITPNKIITANLGNSRSVLAKFENGQYNAINLTRDHKPTESDEMKRILNSGGRIKQITDSRTGKNIGPERIWLKNSEIPGLAMSRSLGDNLAHMVGVIAEPEIKTFEYDGNEKFILLASNGIWEFIDSDESVRIIKDFYEKDMDAVGALNTIVREAFKRWKSEKDSIDDITTVLIFFE